MGPLGQKVREWSSIYNIMDLEHTLHQKWNQIPMAVVQMLISSMMQTVWLILELSEVISDTK